MYLRVLNERRPRSRRARRGVSWPGLAAVLSALVGLPLLAWSLTMGDGGVPENRLTAKVERTAFTHLITERGEIDSSTNVDVRCEVKSQYMDGTVILEVVPEGTQVEVGDVLVTLDASALRAERIQQQILCNTSAALVTQSQNAYETAVIALREYQEGTFRQEEQTIQGEIFVAEENQRRAEEYLRYSQGLAARGYVTQLQLEADKFAVEKARNELEAAKTKLHVLQEFTRTKMVKQLEADIKTTAAKLEADENSNKLDQEKLADIISEIDKCVIRAPAAGQVVYANDTDRRGRDDIIIEPGAQVRERQVIIRLPDPTKMQVTTDINEGNVRLVKPGMPATIRIDAFPEMVLTGVVEKVNDYPESGGWMRQNVKEYETTVSIHNPPRGLKPGMTAEASIRVEEIPDALVTPLQAIVEHGGKHYCLMEDGLDLTYREVLIGSANDKYVVIQDGLLENDAVVLSPRTYLSQVNMPAIAETSVARQDASAPVEVARLDDAELADAEISSDAAADAMGQMDENGDGRLAISELPESMRERFAENDRDGDGYLNRPEAAALISNVDYGDRAAGGVGQ